MRPQNLVTPVRLLQVLRTGARKPILHAGITLGMGLDDARDAAGLYKGFKGSMRQLNTGPDVHDLPWLAIPCNHLSDRDGNTRPLLRGDWHRLARPGVLRTSAPRVAEDLHACGLYQCHSP